ncbi:MAG: class I SAM-dependent methyltransferase [Desulfobacterales bacterium]|nr:class I SAM-dependent methyltransferase [Desulfobacterales bacterium]
MSGEWNRLWQQKLNPFGLKLLEDAEKTALRMMVRNLDDNASILDVGCGTGRSLAKIFGLFKDAKGVDYSDVSVQLCKEKGLNVSLEDARNLPLKDDSVDLVFSEGLLEHYGDMEPLVKEMCRVSKKYVLLVQPNLDSKARKVRDLYWRVTGRLYAEELPYKVVDYVAMFRKFGFDVAEADNTILFHVLLFKVRV